jgi:hypothetical protein
MMISIVQFLSAKFRLANGRVASWIAANHTWGTALGPWAGKAAALSEPSERLNKSPIPGGVASEERTG